MNFPLVLFVLLVITGFVWFLDYFLLRHKREPNESEPWWIEYPKSFFPVILIVFSLRSFVVEPFKIPSGSMIPTLIVGDFILVNKYTYGIRLPVINKKLIDLNEPKRGEVMVFRYPADPSIDYIKRVVGLPGDTVSYQNKRLTLNDEPVETKYESEYKYLESGLGYVYTDFFHEFLGKESHTIITEPNVPGIQMSGIHQFPHRESCTFNMSGFTCVVPEGNYLTLGDNRDSSSDSRYWGFVPEQNIVGKAFMVWWNFSSFDRVGLSIQ